VVVCWIYVPHTLVNFIGNCKTRGETLYLCFTSLYNLHLKKYFSSLESYAVLWSETRADLHVSFFFFVCRSNWNLKLLDSFFCKIFHFTFGENPSSGYRIVSCVQTDGLGEPDGNEWAYKLNTSVQSRLEPTLRWMAVSAGNQWRKTRHDGWRRWDHRRVTTRAESISRPRAFASRTDAPVCAYIFLQHRTVTSY
jgi:hypothetical protein